MLLRVFVRVLLAVTRQVKRQRNHLGRRRLESSSSRCGGVGVHAHASSTDTSSTCRPRLRVDFARVHGPPQPLLPLLFTIRTGACGSPEPFCHRRARRLTYVHPRFRRYYTLSAMKCFQMRARISSANGLGLGFVYLPCLPCLPCLPAPFLLLSARVLLFAPTPTLASAQLDASASLQLHQRSRAPLYLSRDLPRTLT